MPIKENLIDMTLAEPEPVDELNQLWVLKQEFSGMNCNDKVQYLRLKMREHNCDCYVLTALDEIAWLLNSIFPIDVANDSPWKRYAVQPSFLLISRLAP